jgi:hypothetical protein
VSNDSELVVTNFRLAHGENTGGGVREPTDPADQDMRLVISGHLRDDPQKRIYEFVWTAEQSRSLHRLLGSTMPWWGPTAYDRPTPPS